MKNIRNYYLVQIVFSLLPFISWIALRLHTESTVTNDSANLIFNAAFVVFFMQTMVLLQYISLNKFLNELLLKKNFLRINGLIAVIFTTALLIFQGIGIFDFLIGNVEVSNSHSLQPITSINLSGKLIWLFATHAVFTLIFTAFSMKSQYKKKSKDENVKLKYKKYVIPAMIQAWMPLVILFIAIFVSILNDLKRFP